jgi:stage II sporulation protein D
MKPGSNFVSVRTCLFLLFSLLALTSNGQRLQIGLWGGKPMQRVHFKIANGSYDLLVDESSKLQLTAGQTGVLSWTSASVKVETGGKSFLGKKILFKSTTGNAEFHLTPENPKKDKRQYQDDLKIVHKPSGMILVNEVNREKYVAGVVEAESGKDQLYEYYKVQAIICRSYASSNRNKHYAEGFHLCDEVHCQVYHGKSRWNDSIPLATYATKGFVLVDSDANLITAAFHSNCGGHTVNSEMVWSKHLPYLIGRPDSFCLKSSQSHWEKEISAREWRTYLEKNFKYNMADSLAAFKATHYYPGSKSRYMMDEKLAISLIKIRTDWKLKSTHFIIHEEGEKVKLIGRGFGHGIGLCQEGAMQMCRLGYSFQDVLHFYYHNVRLVDENHLGFFKD